jgi:beta-galactosidase
LDSLNRAWKRRYSSFAEIAPGKTFGRPYTEMTAFMHFFTERANAHAKLRYDTIKAVDPAHPVTVHGGQPSTYYTGEMQGWYAMPLDRGNDWAFAEEIDGVGFSSFPKWSNQDDTTFAVRVSIGASAARSKNKRLWLSELQGGRSSIGFTEPHFAVDAKSQQRWLWNGIAGGADTVLFWCWRDEVFGRESNGFGIIGNDGHKDERIAALKRTGEILVKYEALFNGYRPREGEAGVLFSPQTYYLYAAQEGKAERVFAAMEGYCRALSRLNIPYTVVEEEHLASLDGLKILFIPKTLVLAERTEPILKAFVENGGTLVCESEFGSFNTAGIYRYPEDRFISQLTGAREIGRRNLPKGDGEKPAAIAFRYAGEDISLAPAQWLTPFTHKKGTVFASDAEGALGVEVSCGKGRVILIGTYLGENNKDNPQLERFVNAVTRTAKVAPPVTVLEPLPAGRNFVQAIAGDSQKKKVVFVFFPRECDCKKTSLSFSPDYFNSGKLMDIVSGQSVTVRNGDCDVPNNNLALAILAEA